MLVIPALLRLQGDQEGTTQLGQISELQVQREIMPPQIRDQLRTLPDVYFWPTHVHAHATPHTHTYTHTLSHEKCETKYKLGRLDKSQ